VVEELATIAAKRVTPRRTVPIPRRLLAVIVMPKAMSLRSAHFLETILESSVKIARKWVTPRSVVKLLWFLMMMLVPDMGLARQVMAYTAVILVVIAIVPSPLLLLLGETTGVPRESHLEVAKAGALPKLLLPGGKFLIIVASFQFANFLVVSMGQSSRLILRTGWRGLFWELQNGDENCSAGTMYPSRPY
jgi:hypothetical protein